LMWRALRAGALRGGAPAQARWPDMRILAHWRLFAALALSLGFAIGLVGRGPPFWLAAAIYVSLMVFVFQYGGRRASGTLGRGALVAVLFGTISGLTIHFLFQDVFLVRLP
jgi:hypothetical protein